jgi:glycosyltransferase involved in cell wall biosynthesis
MRNEKPTLVLLIPGFAANESDTTCLPQQQAFAHALKNNFPGHYFIILAFQYPFVSAPYIWKGIPVKPLNGKEKGGLRRLLTWSKAWMQLKKIKRENNVIGLLSFWCGECGLVGSRFARKNGLPHYNWILGQDARADNKYVHRINPRPEDLIALSDFLQATFQKNHHILPAQVIPPGIAISDFPPQQAPEKTIDILGAGSLIPLKQFPVFQEIIAEVKKEFPYVKAMICGKGPEKENLQKQILSLQLQDQVELKGEIAHPELLRLMQSSRILLHPSSYEGFSGVCMEALYAGADVISFHKPMNESIPHWHSMQSKEQMVEKVLEILRSKAERRVHVLYHSIDDTANKVMKLFGH